MSINANKGTTGQGVVVEKPRVLSDFTVARSKRTVRRKGQGQLMMIRAF